MQKEINWEYSEGHRIHCFRGQRGGQSSSDDLFWLNLLIPTVCFSGHITGTLGLKMSMVNTMSVSNKISFIYDLVVDAFYARGSFQIFFKGSLM